MVWKCEVIGCPTTRNSGIRMHPFQRDAALLKKWASATGKSDLENHPNVLKKCICDLHFSDQQKFASTARNRTNLVYGAVPDCNLPTKTIFDGRGVLANRTNLVNDEVSNHNLPKTPIFDGVIRNWTNVVSHAMSDSNLSKKTIQILEDATTEQTNMVVNNPVSDSSG